MLYVFLKFSKLLTAAMLFSLLLSSCNEENLDGASEYSCSTADGLWTVVGATCDGEAIKDVAPVTYIFSKDTGLVTQTTGRVDCATTFDWLVEVGKETAIFSMTGKGTLSCTQSGVDVSFCSSDVNSCNAGIDISGIKNEYPTCVITSEGMGLVRTVSAVNNPDNLSYCEDGQEELVRLVQGEYIPTEPEVEPDSKTAFLKVAGPNPLDFGTHSIGSRVIETLAVTNIGNGLASGVDGSGLDSPYLFLGGQYPGVGGTCQSSLEIKETCTIVIEFFPSVIGYFTDNLVIRYSNGKGSSSIIHGLAGTASQSLAQLKISEGPFYNFGAVKVGETESFQFTVANNGGGNALALSNSGLEAPFSYVGGLYPGTNGDCGVTLADGDSCVLDIEFIPAAQGPFNDVIEINYLDGMNTQQVTRNIFGQGIP